MFVLIALGSGCAWHRAVHHDQLASPATESSFVRDQLIVHAPFGLDRNHALLQELLELRTRISGSLALPSSDESIHVYLYETPARYQTQAAHYFPTTQPRRAFFVKNQERLNVHAQWGDSAAVDLRHELTHGYLHASLHTLPLWLDEGLAEYFELSADQAGNHSEHVTWLREQRATADWTPDLLRMEALATAGQMTQTDYAESWLWTHWLLHSTPEHRTILQGYLAEIRRDNALAPLSLKLRNQTSHPHRELLIHLESL